MTALDYSQRIKALGTDFAGLIPDYETDLYRNPYFLDRGIVGISFEPTFVYYYRQYLYQYIAVNQKPVKLLLMNKNMGMMGQYWANYSHDLEPGNYGWRSSTYKAFLVNDVWMYRMRKAVINLYNDLDYAKLSYLTSTNSEATEGKTEYIAKTQVSLQIRKRLNLDLKFGYGFYENSKEMDQNEILKQRINLGLFRMGLYCRSISSPNDFTSWYVDIGSPITNTDVDSLPYSVYSRVANHESEFVLLANTISSRFGAAKAVPIGDRGFLAIGFTDHFLVQNTEENQDTLENVGLQGIVNTASIPTALEYTVNTVSFRFGAKISYTFKNLRETKFVVIAQDLYHTLSYDYSFGIGWQPHKKVALDIYNNSNFAYLRDWAIYVRYIF
jgi:hypothetical protein